MKHLPSLHIRKRQGCGFEGEIRLLSGAEGFSEKQAPMMDYSTLPNDPDHPAGTSPWQSSPQLSGRPSFNASESDSAQPPYLNTLQRHSEDYGSDQDIVVDGSNPPQYGSAPPPENGIYQDPPQKSIKSDGQGLQPHRQPQTRQQHQQQQPPQKSPGPNRYHGANRPPQKQTLPQYRLHAKITGLERTGRKDPVLRFDVHVRSSDPLCPPVLTNRRRIFPGSAPPSFETYAAHTLSSSS